MEALKAIKIIGNQNDGRAGFFYFFQIPGNKGFKFHARPQTGAYSCYILKNKGSKYESSRYNIYERASSGLSKNRSRFPNRPSWAELRRAQSCRFSSFSTEMGGTHYRRTINVRNLPDHECVYLDWNCALGWVKKNANNPGRQK